MKKIKDMDWWNKMVFPVRRVWVSVSARVKARKNGESSLSLNCYFGEKWVEGCVI